MMLHALRCELLVEECGRMRGWSFEQWFVVVAADELPAVVGFVPEELDDPAVDVFVMPAAQQRQVPDVRRAFGPRHHMMRFAPPSFALAAGHDTTAVAHGQRSPLAVGGGV